MEIANSSPVKLHNGSAPPSRTNSFKNKPRARGVQKLIDVPRRNSMPDTGAKDLLSVIKRGRQWGTVTSCALVQNDVKRNRQ